MKRYAAICDVLYNRPHLVTQEKLHQIVSLIDRRAAGEELAIEFEAESERPRGQLVAVDSGEMFGFDQLAADAVPATSSAPRQFVAVLPLFGTLFQHGGLEMDASGGTSTEQWQREFKRLAGNPAVKTIVVETHSPGGQCIGVQEAADAVRAERDSGRTRIVSVANSQMASAAVWIGTAAHQVLVTPGGEIGSIGVVSIHQDFSKMDESLGVKTTFIATSRKKILGNQYEPLDDEGRAMFEADNKVVYDRFVAAMAANRGVTPAKVEADFGGGGMLWAEDAVRVGLADGVATMADVLAAEVARVRVAGKKSKRNALAVAQAKLAG